MLSNSPYGLSTAVLGGRSVGAHCCCCCYQASFDTIFVNRVDFIGCTSLLLIFSLSSTIIADITMTKMRVGRSVAALLLVLFLKVVRGLDFCPEQCQGNFSHCEAICNNAGAAADASIVTCQYSTFDGATATCSYGACRYSDFIDSNVTCGGDGSTCGISSFNHSVVSCLSDSCSDARFFSSAVTCDGYYSCGASTLFSACSCCDGNSCPSGYPSCTVDPVAFCDKTFLGRNCQEWGNPVCDGLFIGRFLFLCCILMLIRSNKYKLLSATHAKFL
jgi:hypothetical protein